MENQNNTIKDISNNYANEVFYKDISLLNLSLNICCTLELENNLVKKYHLYDNGILISKGDLSLIRDYCWTKLPLKVKKDHLDKVLKNHFREICQKAISMHMEVENIKTISVLNFSDKNNLHISYWSSFPVLENQDQVTDYLQSVEKLGKMSLNSDELSDLLNLVQKIKTKLNRST